MTFENIVATVMATLAVRPETAGARTGLLYALNTWGAVAGTLLAACDRPASQDATAVADLLLTNAEVVTVDGEVVCDGLDADLEGRPRWCEHRVFLGSHEVALLTKDHGERAWFTRIDIVLIVIELVLVDQLNIAGTLWPDLATRQISRFLPSGTRLPGFAQISVERGLRLIENPVGDPRQLERIRHVVDPVDQKTDCRYGQ